MVCSFTECNKLEDIQLFHTRMWLSVLDWTEQGRAWPGSGGKQQVSSAVGNSPCNSGRKGSSPQTAWWEAASRGANRTRGSERRWRFPLPVWGIQQDAAQQVCRSYLEDLGNKSGLPSCFPAPSLSN